MKKHIISCLSMALVCSASFAQLVVDGSNGYVGIDSDSIKSPLTIGGNGCPFSQVYIQDLDYTTTYLNKRDSIFIVGVQGVAHVEATARNYYGLYGQAYSQTPLNSSRSYGVLGIAGNATQGYNYGIYAALGGINYGAALFATCNASHLQALNYPINGRYAGYFEGPVYGTSTFSAVAFTSTSDERLKQDISNISKERSLNSLMKLSPVEYKLLRMNLNIESDTISNNESISEETEDLLDRTRFGLIAQEVEEIYPELVYEDSNGYKSINYIGLIPMLIQSIQELSVELEELKKDKSNKIINENSSFDNFSIGQNFPNPMIDRCTIKYYIPQTVKTAKLLISDKKGYLLDSFILPHRGNGEIKLTRNKFQIGIYIYSLVIDGEVVDSKQMIVE